MADVTAGHHAVHSLLGAAVGVGLERVRVLDEDRAGHIRLGDPLALIVVQCDPDAHRRFSRGIRCAAQLGRGGHGDHGAFGGAVHVVEGVAEVVQGARHHIRRDRRSGREDDLQRGHVVLAQDLRGQIEHALQHRRYHDQFLGPELLDIGQRLFGIESPLLEHDSVAERQADGELRQSGGVEDRRGHEDRAVARDRNPIDQLRGDEGAHPVSWRALGGTGGSAGQDHHAARLRRQLHRIGGLPGHQRIERRHRCVDAILLVGPGQDARDGLRDGAHQIDEFAVVQDRLDLFAVGDVGELRFGESGVHQHRAHAELAGRQQCEHQTAVVAGQHRDHIALADTLRTQRAGQRIGLPVELTEGQLTALVDDRGGVRAGLRGMHDHARERAVFVDRDDRAHRMIGPQGVEQSAPAHRIGPQDQISDLAKGGASRRKDS